MPAEEPAYGVPTGKTSLRFFGNGVGDIDRVKIRIDDPANSLPGPPADVGADDFTIEFWMRATAADNTAGPRSCGANIDWIYGNIVMDRDRYAQDRKFGLSLVDGRLIWGVSGDGTGDRTICGTTDVLDDAWHHVAVQRRRSDGRMWLFVDGEPEAEADGPNGDVSYPDDGVPGDFCGGPCLQSDPFLVFGAEKHDAGPEFPSYSGYLEEIRISDVIRYTSAFVVEPVAFVPDVNTVALYHLDEGVGDVIGDSSGASGGPSPGERRFGGSPAGPVWTEESPLLDPASSVDDAGWTDGAPGAEGQADAVPGADADSGSRSMASLVVSPQPVARGSQVSAMFRLDAPGGVASMGWDALPDLLVFAPDGRLVATSTAAAVEESGAAFALTIPQRWRNGLYLLQVSGVLGGRRIEAASKLLVH